MDIIYLDNNATTRPDARVAECVCDALREGYGNPASAHSMGRRARRLLEDAREGIAALLGAKATGPRADRVVLTSGATEANNLAIRGLAGSRRANDDGEVPGNVVDSAIEHPRVLEAADHLARQGWEVRRAPVSHDGAVDCDQLQNLIDDRTRLVSVMLVNHETGVVQPVAQIADICKAAGVPIHTDAVQAVGKLPVDFCALGVDALTISGHKFHGPPAIGALIVRHGVKLAPILFGGAQQGGLRGGTENVALAAGLHKALELCHDEAAARAARMAELRDRLESLLRQAMPDIVINGASAPRAPHTSNVAFPGLDRQALVMSLDLADVACSTGSACASGSSERSPVLMAMGCPADVVDGSLRFSLGSFTTAAEIAEAARRIIKAASDLRSAESAREMPLPARNSGGQTV